MDRLEIFTLGGVRILRAGEPLSGLSTRKAEALLIYLASTHRPQPREVLADLLWDERTQSQALSNLRGVLSNLNQVVGEYLIISRDQVELNPASPLWLDTAELEGCLEGQRKPGGLNPASATQAAEAFKLYRGDFLAGFSVYDCRGYEDWTVRERERLHRLAVDSLSGLVENSLARQDYPLGIAHATRLLELDPLMENAHRQMMRLLAESGQRVAALSQYESYQKLLRAELKVDPATETRQLYEQIRLGKSTARDEPDQLPSGTVTFLFTDIEGSTRLLEQLREQYAVVLNEQRELLRDAFQKWHGHEIDTQGDSFFVAFGKASDAIACVIVAQRDLASYTWPQGVSVKVRMGLHTGEPQLARTGYVGLDVHRAARIAAAGHGGQVLLSQATRDLVYQDLPEGSRLRDLGEHQLKDIRFPQRIFQLDIPGLPADFPVLKTLSLAEEPPTPGQPPFKGLQYFDVQDADLFFGRGKVISRLVEMVRQQPFLAMVGASGSGKSSVVRAGLVPALQRNQPQVWEIFILTPTAQPLESLAVHLTRGSESVTACATLMDDLRHEPRSLHLFARKQLLGRQKRWLIVVDQFEELFTLCREAAERQVFVEQLLQAAQASGSQVHVLIALRADFYEHLAEYAELRQAVAQHQEYLGAMNADELRQAIEEPAKLGGWVFTPGLVELMLHEVGAEGDRQPEPGALPLLSHALLETWNHRRGNLMNLKAYAESGGVHRAIARTAERLYSQELSPEQQAIARNIFLRLTELGEGTQDTRRRASLQELLPPAPYADPKEVEEVLVKLADARLIITGEGTAEVAHEALIREWPTLREWLMQNREGLLVQRRLTEAAQEWRLLEREAGVLYRGARLAQAVEWAQANPQQLNAQEQAFLEASQAALQREAAEREAQRERELEAAQKLAQAERRRAEEQSKSAQRLRHRAWLLVGVVAVALILAGAAVMFGRQADSNAKLANQNMAAAQNAEQRALNQQATAESEALQRATAEAIAEQERVAAEGEAQQRATAEAIAVQEKQSAQEQANLATSQYLIAEALKNLNVNSQLSAHLALLAYQAYPTSEAESALHMVLPELRLLSTIPITNSYGGVFSLWIAQDSQLISVGTKDGLELMDRMTGKTTMLLSGMACDYLKSSSDSRWLAADFTSDNVKYIQYVFDTETKKTVFTLPDLGLTQFDLGFIPPSSTHPLLVFSTYLEDMSIHVWDVATGKESLVDRTRAKPSSFSLINAVASQDGKRFATYDDSGYVVLWDMETGRKLAQFNARVSNFGLGIYADFSPDGTRLAVVGGDPVIRVWDLTSLSPGPSLAQELRAGAQMQNLLYSPDGTRLAAGGSDGLIRVWDVQSGELQMTLSGHAGFSFVYSFRRDGTQLYTADNKGFIMEWDLSLSRERLSLSGRIGSASFSPDGTRLALAGTDGSLSIVNSQTGEVLRSWQAHSDLISDIAWSPDGRRLATSSGHSLLGSSHDKSARIWDAETGQLLIELPGSAYQLVIEIPGIPYEGFSHVAWSPDGSRLVTGSENGTTLVWDPALGKLIRMMPKENALWAVAYSPEGQSVAITGESDLILFDIDTGNKVFTYTLNHSGIGLAFSRDGQRLAVGITTGDVFLFKKTANVWEQELGFSNQDKNVAALAFSPDGALLATGDTKGTVRVWDLKTRQRLLEMATFKDLVTWVAFTPDGRHLAVSDAKGTTYFYTLPVQDVIQMIRSRIKLPMTPDQCWQYLQTETCPPE